MFRFIAQVLLCMIVSVDKFLLLLDDLNFSMIVFVKTLAIRIQTPRILSLGPE